MRRTNPGGRAGYGAEAQTRTETVNRRVWVTAQSRQSQASVEKHASKLATEMAAPSSFNGPQHAPSPSRLTQSADGSRATGGLTIGIGFRTSSQSRSGSSAGRGFFSSLSMQILGESAPDSRVHFVAQTARALDSGADSPEKTLPAMKAKGRNSEFL